MKINIKRLMQEIEYYAQFGQVLGEGITRPSFSHGDYEVREIFMNELEKMGLEVHVDAIANIWGKLPCEREDASTIVIGSHLDTVPNGGEFDGALGVLVAKEIVQTLLENHIKLNHHLEIVSFTAEEPNDFNLSTMGSRALTGKLTHSQLMNTSDSTSFKLSEAVKKAGGDLDGISEIKRDDLAAYIELHIEQGKRLEKQNLSIGIVNQIVGIYRDHIQVSGEANHSGTTMMLDRMDALTAASEMVLAVEIVTRSFNTDAVATVGKLNVFPNAANIIPGRVEFILEIRSASREERFDIKEAIYKEFNRIQESRKVIVKYTNILDQQECTFDSEIVRYLQHAAHSLNIPYTTFASMAGHDATHLAGITKAAMIFVKSINGKSHSPEELSLPEDIEKAANTMLHAVLLADKEI
ncbi:M20 family metallo-hydrolase [Bacillus sp. S/N-304-OC-R1]|uniref:M20 family metallo-hydrolase n=1 Tax=Bacillus sp. S/N-304-OC-R1 TaxID=2758034 RepID=UPI001C8D5D6C|nr:M20 family metallo-hydrolase [Bacillus sp. S/N-304-OC-R1]MBY0124520.1 M20 family metallo-hydrolase [Bacillus sp. S/N-304-OC-R1]